MTTDRPTLTGITVPPEAARAFAAAWADLIGSPVPEPVDGVVWAVLWPPVTRRLRAAVVGAGRENLLKETKETA